jgi:hypothetical protein
MANNNYKRAVGSKQKAGIGKQQANQDRKGWFYFLVAGLILEKNLLPMPDTVNVIYLRQRGKDCLLEKPYLPMPINWSELSSPRFHSEHTSSLRRPYNNSGLLWRFDKTE